jgi:cytochrome d ubiquinol oxidase subunit I
MVGLVFFFLALFAASFYYSSKSWCDKKTWLLKLAIFSIPLPYAASELEWFVAEYGRQPWSIYGVLPTFLSTSSLTTKSLVFSLAGFTLFYTVLLIVELALVRKYAKSGPVSELYAETDLSRGVPGMLEKGDLHV